MSWVSPIAPIYPNSNAHPFPHGKLRAILVSTVHFLTFTRFPRIVRSQHVDHHFQHHGEKPWLSCSFPLINSPTAPAIGYLVVPLNLYLILYGHRVNFYTNLWG